MVLYLHITVSGTGDKQKCFCRNGRSFKASIDTLNILRGFFTFGLWFSVGFSLGLQPNRLARYQKGARGPQKIMSHKISGLKRFHPDSLNRVYEKIESFKKYKQGLRRANREKAKHLISSNLEREGDNLTATADHGVVAHMLKSIAEKNCFYFTCYIKGINKRLSYGYITLNPFIDRVYFN
jgi:hypothetical protein